MSDVNSSLHKSAESLANSREQQWYPVVYAATKYLDFRFLAMPRGLQGDELAWIASHLHVSLGHMVSDYRLPVWSAFKNRDLTVVGATCWASLVSSEMIRDQVGRENYGFFGAAIRGPIVSAPQMDLNLFKGLYQFVSARFESRAEDLTLLTAQSEWTWPEPLTALSTGFSPIKLNQSPDRVVLWPAGEADEVWRSFFAFGSPTSVCLNLRRDKEAVAGPFLNATVQGATVQVTFQRELQRVPSSSAALPIRPAVEGGRRKSKSPDHARRSDASEYIADTDRVARRQRPVSRQLSLLQALIDCLRRLIGQNKSAMDPVDDELRPFGKAPAGFRAKDPQERRNRSSFAAFEGMADSKPSESTANDPPPKSENDGGTGAGGQSSR
jgi:hypothetical protein